MANKKQSKKEIKTYNPTQSKFGKIVLIVLALGMFLGMFITAFILMYQSLFS